MVRIYVILEDVGSEYETLVPTEISLKPFEDNCYYLDLEENCSYNSVIYEGDWDNINWKPFNVLYQEHVWFDIDNNKFIQEEDLPYNYNDEKFLEGYKYQKYENGEPIGKPYFEE